MITTAAVPVDGEDTLPPGVSVSVTIESAPGLLTTVLVTTFDDTDPNQDPEDILQSIDGLLVSRNQGGNSLPGLISRTGTKVGNTRTITSVIDNDYHGFAPGPHELRVHWLRLGTSDVSGVKLFLADLPHVPAAVQTPAPQLRQGVIPRGVFHLTVEEFVTRGMNPQVAHDAGVNTVGIGAFANPADWYAGSGPAWEAQVLAVTLVQWDAAWRPGITAKLDWCRANGFLAYLDCDDFYRNGREYWWWANCPWRDEAVRTVRDLMRQYPDVVVCMQGSDECVLGGPVDLDALHAVWHEVPDSPPWSWPGQNPFEFETALRADFATRFYREAGVEFSVPLGDGLNHKSNAQVARVFDVMRQELGNFPAGWPLMAQTGSIMWGGYRKQSFGGSYAPAYGDVLLRTGTLPEEVALAIWCPLLIGARAIRVYNFDLTGDRQARVADNYGSPLEVGVGADTPLWAALGVVLNSVASRESLLLSRTPLPVTYKDNWFFGGVDGLAVAINCGTFSRPCPYLSRGVLLTVTEQPYSGGAVPPAGVVLSV